MEKNNEISNNPRKILIEKNNRKVSFNDSIADSDQNGICPFNNGFFGFFESGKEIKSILKSPSPKNEDDNKNNLIKNNKFPSKKDIDKNNLDKNEKNNISKKNNDSKNKKGMNNIEININTNPRNLNKEKNKEINPNERNIKLEEKKEGENIINMAEDIKINENINNEKNEENKENIEKINEETKDNGERAMNNISNNFLNKADNINIIQDIMDSNEHVIISDISKNKEIGEIVKSGEIFVEQNQNLNDEIKLKSPNNIGNFTEMKSDLEKREKKNENANPIIENILENNNQNHEENKNNT